MTTTFTRTFVAPLEAAPAKVMELIKAAESLGFDWQVRLAPTGEERCTVELAFQREDDR